MGGVHWFPGGACCQEWRTASPEIIITWNRHTSFGQKRLTCFNRKQRRGEGGWVFLLGRGLLGNDLIMLLDCRILRGGGDSGISAGGKCPRNHGFLICCFRFLMVSQCCLRRTQGLFHRVGLFICTYPKLGEMIHIDLCLLEAAPPPSNSDLLNF